MTIAWDDGPQGSPSTPTPIHNVRGKSFVRLLDGNLAHLAESAGRPPAGPPGGRRKAVRRRPQGVRALPRSQVPRQPIGRYSRLQNGQPGVAKDAALAALVSALRGGLRRRDALLVAAPEDPTNLDARELLAPSHPVVVDARPHLPRVADDRTWAICAGWPGRGRSPRPRTEGHGGAALGGRSTTSG